MRNGQNQHDEPRNEGTDRLPTYAELAADLETEQRLHRDTERRLEELDVDLESESCRADKAQARVEELEVALDGWRDGLRLAALKQEEASERATKAERTIVTVRAHAETLQSWADHHAPSDPRDAGYVEGRSLSAVRLLEILDDITQDDDA